jgi:hypothetical protein
MKQGSKKVDYRGIAAGVAGGGILMLVAAQLLAKPSAPALAKATPRSGGQSTAREQVAGTRVTAAPVPSKLAAAPPVRELFRPLISIQKAPIPTAPPAAPAKPAPQLPSATANNTITPTPAAAPAPAAPTGVPASDLQMLGVVELGGTAKVLLKRSTTGESRYFAQGEDAFGFKVGEIKADEVALARDGKNERVVMSSAVSIEGPGSTSVASSSGFSGYGGGRSSGGYGRSSYGGGSDRSSRGDRSSYGGGDRGDRGSRDRGNGSTGGSSESSGGFSTASIMSLPTWVERLKKLEEVKSQVEPEKYERLHKFMAARAEQEKSEKK